MFHSFRDPAEIFEVVVHIGNSDFDRINVLVRSLDACQRSIHRQPRFPPLDCPPRRVPAVGKALPRHKKISQRFVLRPLRIHHHEVHIGPIVTGRIREHPHRRIIL